MLERIQGLPENVLGFSAKGEVTGKDYESVLIPAVEELLIRYKKVRLLYHIGEEFAGFDAKALLDDARVGIQHFYAWDKICVVTDVGGLAQQYMYSALQSPDTSGSSVIENWKRLGSGCQNSCNAH